MRVCACLLQVSGNNTQDYCRLEFEYATGRKGTDAMPVVVMEEGMKQPEKWTGLVYTDLKGRIYTPGWTDASLAETVDSIFEELCDRIEGLRERYGGTSRGEEML